ncbi:MAG: DNA polymerase III subunit beta [Synergistaceae bacterium]|nr:DNA polymerase III subunit beta [Synergistaceae bacterium]
MKLKVNKKQFIQSWSLAERSTTSSTSMSILSSVFIKASEEEVTMQATDVRTSIICMALGVVVEEPGEAVFPVKGISEIFKKISCEEFSLVVDDSGKIIIKAGHGKYNFASYPIREFPSLPSSEAARLFCTIGVGELSKVIEEGTLAASTGEEFPLYLSSANFQTAGGILNIVSTDTRRLAISGAVVNQSEEGVSSLLPMKGIKEVQRILVSLDPESQIKILYDDSQFYFSADSLEFSVRRVESRFPPYEKIIPKGHTTNISLDRGELISALERVDVVVRDFNRMVILDIKAGEPLVLRGKAPDFGLAKEEVSKSDVKGESLVIAVNSKFFMEALKVMRDPEVVLSFNGSKGQMAVRRAEDDSFLCLIAPINIPEEELKMDEMA